jgi:hypothetical protein
MLIALFDFLAVIAIIILVFKDSQFTFAMSFQWTETIPKVSFSFNKGWSCAWIGKKSYEDMMDVLQKEKVPDDRPRENRIDS